MPETPAAAAAHKDHLAGNADVHHSSMDADGVIDDDMAATDSQHGSDLLGDGADDGAAPPTSLPSLGDDVTAADEAGSDDEGGNGGLDEQPPAAADATARVKNPMYAVRKSISDKNARKTQQLQQSLIDFEAYAHHHAPHRVKEVVPPAHMDITLLPSSKSGAMIRTSGVFNDPQLLQHAQTLAQFAEVKRVYKKVCFWS